MTGEDENVMKTASYEDGDWILNSFDNRASAVQKLKYGRGCVIIHPPLRSW